MHTTCNMWKGISDTRFQHRVPICSEAGVRERGKGVFTLSVKYFNK